jgi:ADP-ribosylglycohydrolase
LEKVQEDNLLIRARACLWGGAVGDAMGKATEGYSSAGIIESYGQALEGFVEPIQPLSQFSWVRAEVTEDTRQTVCVAKAIVEQGKVDQLSIAKHLLNCDHKGIGTSSRLFRFILNKDIGYVANKGSGNGAAMRIAPVGLVNSASDLEKLVEDVYKACIMTHGGKAGIAGAAAMAAAVAAAVEGWPGGYVMIQALKAAKLAERLGHADNLTPVAQQIQLAIDLATELSGEELIRKVGQEIGWGFKACEAVPAALVLATTQLSAKDAILAAVNQGGDADAIAGMAGCLASALNPYTLPKKWIEEVQTVNKLDMDALASKLSALRPVHTKVHSELRWLEIGG